MSDASLQTDPIAVTKGFLDALAANDIDGALGLVADDIAYTNVSLPTIRGHRALDRLFRPMLGKVGFRVICRNIAADVDADGDGVVLTERTDGLIFGPVALTFWVYGRFEVRNGQITVWRDSFDYGDMTVGLVRALVGAFVPAFNRRWPTD